MRSQEELKAVRLVTPEGRLVFCKNLFKVHDKGRYSACVLFDNSEENQKALAPLGELIEEFKTDQWGEKKPSNLHSPIKVETRAEMIEKYPFMKDKIVLNASNGFEPGVIDVHGKELFDGDIKAGDHVKVSISAYAYDNKVKGIGFNVNGLQLVKEGEALYGRQSTADLFGITPASLENVEAKKPDSAFGNFSF
jgi:hypothetical protein